MAKQTRNAPAEEPKPQQTAPDPKAYTWDGEGATGFEGTRPEDFGIAFLVLLQKGSAEVDEDHPDHATKKIEGAKSGMIINTLTREIVYAKDETKPLQFVAFFHEKLYQEWKDRKNGGGFVQSHASPVILTTTKRNEKNEDVLPNGNIIRTTSYFAGFLLVNGLTDLQNPDESLRPIRVILPMSSTQLKKARQWLNMMDAIKINGRTPPMFSHIYNLTTVPESNDKGNWQGWKIEINRVLTIDDVTLIQDAKKLALEASTTSTNAKMLAAPVTDEHSSEDERADDEAAQADRRAARSGH